MKILILSDEEYNELSKFSLKLYRDLKPFFKRRNISKVRVWHNLLDKILSL